MCGKYIYMLIYMSKKVNLSPVQQKNERHIRKFTSKLLVLYLVNN